MPLVSNIVREATLSSIDSGEVRSTVDDAAWAPELHKYIAMSWSAMRWWNFLSSFNLIADDSVAVAVTDRRVKTTCRE